MRGLAIIVALLTSGFNGQLSHAQTMLFSTSDTDYEVTNLFGDVDKFDFLIEIDAPLAPGFYDNPPIVSVSYRVSGNLSAGTPSDFDLFALERIITGTEFYNQGSSLQFEIDQAAVLDDGIQITELAGSDLLFTFNGREVDTGRFHPALFELRSNGTGSIQNSSNIPTLDPLVEVARGAEYVNDLVFDPGNTTLITEKDVKSTSSGGVLSLLEYLLLSFYAILWINWRSYLKRIQQSSSIRKAPTSKQDHPA